VAIVPESSPIFVSQVTGSLQVKPYPLAEDYRFSYPPQDGALINFRMATEVMQKTKCKACNSTESLEPFIVPPTWSKRIADTPAAAVWKKAVEEMKEAFQIVVIGYSMPRTDTFFQYLLTLGLEENNRLHRVVIVDIDESDDFRDRYERVFARSLKDRGGLKFLRTSFESYIDSSMRIVGKNTEWPKSLES
jgi:hypothetical protein